MPVAVQSVQRKAEREYVSERQPDAIDRVLQGLQIAQGVFGIASNIQNIQNAKVQREAAVQEFQAKKGAAERGAAGALTKGEYRDVVAEGKLTPVAAPQEGEPADPGVLRAFVLGEKGEREPVFFRQAKPLAAAATAEETATRAAADRESREKITKMRLDAEALKKKNSVTISKAKEAVGKEPTPAELQKVEQAEAMIGANEKLAEQLKTFDPTSRLYMGQMSLPVGAKADKWQAYETYARQFLDPIARARTGAAMPDSEVKTYMQQYFPMPGDTPEVVAQKEFMRQKGIDEVMVQGRRAIPLKKTTQPTTVVPPKQGQPKLLKATDLPKL